MTTTYSRNLVLETEGSLKEPGTPLPEGATDSITAYMRNFPYSIKVSFGRVWTDEFKEFNRWCENHLGVKYKDWFLVGNPGDYTLYLKDTKKSMFLTLKYSEAIDSTNF